MKTNLNITTKRALGITLLILVAMFAKSCGGDSNYDGTLQPIPESEFREYNNQVMFSDDDNDIDYLADIINARTGARYETLQQLGIVEKLQNVTAEAYNNAIGPGAKPRFTNVFNPDNGGRGKVQIVIENHVDYDSYEIDNSVNIRFSFDYLLSVLAADLQTVIAAAVVEMNGLIAVIERSITHDAVMLAKKSDKLNIQKLAHLKYGRGF